MLEKSLSRKQNSGTSILAFNAKKASYVLKMITDDTDLALMQTVLLLIKCIVALLVIETKPSTGKLWVFSRRFYFLLLFLRVYGKTDMTLQRQLFFPQKMLFS